MRKSWDEFYVAMAKFVSTRSKDPSTQTGAVIVRPDRSVAGVGYNGFPTGIEDTKERLENRNEKMRLIVHCEMNALISANEDVRGYTLYTYPFHSCNRCAVHMIQAGISRVVAPACPSDKVDRWQEELDRSIELFKEAGVEVDFVND